MIEKELRIQDATLKDLEILFDNKVTSALDKFHKQIESDKNKEIVFTRNEALDFLKVTGATLIRWQKSGKIKFKAIGGRRYYLKSELMKCFK